MPTFQVQMATVWRPDPPGKAALHQHKCWGASLLTREMERVLLQLQIDAIGTVQPAKSRQTYHQVAATLCSQGCLRVALYWEKYVMDVLQRFDVVQREEHTCNIHNFVQLIHGRCSRKHGLPSKQLPKNAACSSEYENWAWTNIAPFAPVIKANFGASEEKKQFTSVSLWFGCMPERYR